MGNQIREVEQDSLELTSEQRAARTPELLQHADGEEDPVKGTLFLSQASNFTD